MNPFRIRSFTTAASVGVALLCSNCATVFNRTTQPVRVASNPSGLTFKVTDKEGVVVGNGTTPGEVRLKTSSNYFVPAAYIFTFSKNGKVVGSQVLTARVSGWYAGNILIGGLIGLVIVDPLTGAMYTLPDDVNFGGQPMASVTHDSGSLQFVSIDQLDGEQRARLARL
ncbi:hypothetical protein [Haloferula sargassicola]|uniref:PEGA domain-containing protein n=1 Tax=Haloferula sargassicola TaxID=490096 RepID=A0ABP9UQP9_9BACT